jgi:hypothetical protein
MWLIWRDRSPSVYSGDNVFIFSWMNWAKGMKKLERPATQLRSHLASYYIGSDRFVNTLYNYIPFMWCPDKSMKWTLWPEVNVAKLQCNEFSLLLQLISILAALFRTQIHWHTLEGVPLLEHCHSSKASAKSLRRAAVGGWIRVWLRARG